MTGDTSIRSAAEDRITALCIGQAVVDCITRGVEDDPFGRGKTRAQRSTNPLCSLHWDTELV